MTVPHLIVLTLAAGLLAGCAPGTPDASATDDPVVVAPETPTAEPEETVDPEVELRATVIDAVSSGNTAALEGSLAPSVHLTYCASEAEGDVTDHALVVNNISEVTAPSATWDFDLPASKLDTYANHPGHYPSYADDFPAGAIVGLSSEHKVISFVVEGALITRVFICLDEYALTFAD
ncbi:MAG TPA: hypothetical protein VNR36_11930 [Pseudolysinimonas sp.]|nr:hypothetical protein [Pseudolysinimonas sp.]